MKYYCGIQLLDARLLLDTIKSLKKQVKGLEKSRNKLRERVNFEFDGSNVDVLELQKRIKTEAYRNTELNEELTEAHDQLSNLRRFIHDNINTK